MEKVFILKPESSDDERELQSLLDEGYTVKFATAGHVAVAKGGAGYGHEKLIGTITYILEEPKEE